MHGTIHDGVVGAELGIGDLNGTIGVVTICTDVEAGDTGSATGGEAGEAGGLGEQLGEVTTAVLEILNDYLRQNSRLRVGERRSGRLPVPEAKRDSMVLPVHAPANPASE